MVNENIEKKSEKEENENNNENIENLNNENNNEDVNKAVELLEEKNKNLLNENEDLKLKLEKEINDRSKWVAAEAENTRREMNAEILRIVKFGNKRIITWVLNFFIDLKSRFLNFFENEYRDDEKIGPHITGMKIIVDGLWNNLNKEGLKKMELKVNSDVWNSFYHEFFDSVIDDKFPESTIIDVVEDGYLYNDEVIKPAKVIISKKSDSK